MAQILTPFREKAIQLHFEQGVTGAAIAKSEDFNGKVSRKTIYAWLSQHKDQQQAKSA